MDSKLNNLKVKRIQSHRNLDNPGFFLKFKLKSLMLSYYNDYRFKIFYSQDLGFLFGKLYLFF